MIKLGREIMTVNDDIGRRNNGDSLTAQKFETFSLSVNLLVQTRNQCAENEEAKDFHYGLTNYYFTMSVAYHSKVYVFSSACWYV